MSELNEESGATEETVSLEEALAQNFAALSGESESTESPTLPETGDVTGDETVVEQPAETDQESLTDALEPLEKWTDEYKEMFSGLTREHQQFILDRHKETESYLTKESQALAETRKRYERLDEVFKPYDELAKKNGVDLTPHVAQALNYYFHFQQDPLSTVRTLIESAGLEQDQVFEDDSLVDPSIRALRSELKQTQQELAQLKSQKPSEDQSETVAAQKQLEEFTSAVDDSGNPKHPHFEQVKHLMAPLVADGKSLESAYEEVLWTMPDFRKAQMEKERKEALKQEEAKRAEKAKKAKTASDTLPASDVDKSGGLPPVGKNWEAALKHTLSNMS